MKFLLSAAAAILLINSVNSQTCIQYQCDAGENESCSTLNPLKVDICEQGYVCMGNSSNPLDPDYKCNVKVDLDGECVTFGDNLSNCYTDLTCVDGKCAQQNNTIQVGGECSKNESCVTNICQDGKCAPISSCNITDVTIDPSACPFGQYQKCNPLTGESTCVEWLKEGDECSSSYQCSYDMICSVNANDDSSGSISSDSSASSQSASQSNSSQSGSQSNSSQSGSQSNSSQSGSQSNSSQSNSSQSNSSQSNSSQSGSQSNSSSSSSIPTGMFCRKQFTKKEGEKCSTYNAPLIGNEKATLTPYSSTLNRMDCDLADGLVCGSNGTCVKLETGKDCTNDTTACDSSYEKCICNSGSSSSSASSGSSNSTASSSASGSESSSNSTASSSDMSGSGSNSTASSSASGSESSSNSTASSSDMSGSGSNSTDSQSSTNNNTPNFLRAVNADSSSNSTASSSASGSESSSSNSTSSSSASGSGSESSSSNSTSSSTSEDFGATCVPIANYNGECKDSLMKITQCALDNECNLGGELTGESCLVKHCLSDLCESSCFATQLSCTKDDICRFHYSSSESHSSSNSSSNSTSESDGSPASTTTPAILVMVALSIMSLLY